MSRLTRRQFLALVGLEGLAVLISSCAPKEQPTPSPSPTKVPPTPEPTATPQPTKVPEVKIQSLREAVALFRAADKIPPPYPKEEMIATGGANPITLRVVRWGEHQFEIGPKRNAMNVQFLDNRASVVLPSGGAPEQVKSTVNGMLMIPEMTGPGGQTFIKHLEEKARAQNVLSRGETLQDAQELEINWSNYALQIKVQGTGSQTPEWLTLPWLTHQNAIANCVVKNNAVWVRYQFPNGETLDVPLENLLVRAKETRVTSDGEYRVDNKRYGRILRERKTDPKVIEAHEELFIPPILKGEWSSWKEGSDTYHDASKAYEFVGSKNDEHAHLLDLQMGTLNVGLTVKEDLTALPLTLKREGDNISVTRDPKKLLALKEKYGSMIMNNEGEMRGVQEKLMAVRKQIRNNPDWADEIDQNGYRNFFVIITGGTIAQVIRRTRDASGKQVLERFMWDEGKLIPYAEYQKAKAEKEGRKVKPEDLEYQLYSREPLTVRDGKIWEGDKEFIPRGVLNGLLSSSGVYREPEKELEIFKREVDWLVRLGCNFIHVFFNLGEEYVDNPRYKRVLLEGVEYAKRMGLRVLATPREMGTLPLPRWVGNQDTINYLDQARYIRNWQTFLSDNSFNQRFWKAVDIFNPLCEPAYKIEGLPYKNDLAKRRQYELSWRETKSFNEQVFRMLEEKVPDHRLLHAYSPPHWAADVEKIFEDLPSGNNWVLEWHYYEGALTDPDLKRRTFEQELNLIKENLIKEKKIPVYVGEMGWNNSLPYILNQFELLLREGIGYAYHAIDIRNTTEVTIINPHGINLRGHIVTIYNRRFASLR